MVVKHDVNFLDSSDTSLQITIVTLKVKHIMILISPNTNFALFLQQYNSLW